MKTILNNGSISATILHKGAELCSLKNLNNEHIWDGNPEFWPKHSPVLFPIIGTLKNDSYCYDGKNYTLSRHGFARDLDFEKVEFTEYSATFRLRNCDETFARYPFCFEFLVSYELIKNQLKISFMVKNLNDFPMPFSVGAHPAFYLPDGFEHYDLEFECEENLECFKLVDGLISDEKYAVEIRNKVMPLRFETFENDALVIKKLKSKQITIKQKERSILAVSFADFPYLGLWTKPKANFICIEPWSGYADIVGENSDILQKEGIEILASLSTNVKSYTITIFEPKF